MNVLWHEERAFSGFIKARNRKEEKNPGGERIPEKN